MKYGDALPLDYSIPTSAFWLRKDLTEGGNPFKLLDLHHADRVMDCGLYIGTFTAACMEQGAAAARCYEAAPKNAALARENLRRYPGVEIIEAALTAGDEATVKLTMSGFSGANSILPSENRKKAIRVAAVNFRRELLAFAPTVLKLDVEGAEYDLLDSLQSGDMTSVRTFFVEFHPIVDRDDRIAKVRTYFRSEGGYALKSDRRRAFIGERTA